MLRGAVLPVMAAWLAQSGTAAELLPPYAGASACGACHAEKFAQQSATGHAKTLHPAAQHPLAGRFVPSGGIRQEGNVRYRFTLSPSQYQVQIFDQQEGWEIPMEWAFGSGQQGVTFLTRMSANWYLEHRFSYYSSTKSLEVTPGQHLQQPRNLPQAVGIRTSVMDRKEGVLRCFECHSTGGVALDEEGRIQPGELGVRCEACHGPGQPHVAAAAKGNLDRDRTLITNPGRLGGEGLNQLCGNCHRRPPIAGVSIDWEDAWNVRHQPVYFSQSQCFRNSANDLSCLTCHEVHAPLRRDEPAYYRQLCLRCHEQPVHPADLRVNELADCVGCHMPKVAATPYLRFTNHWIGVYRAGKVLKPL